MKLNIIIVSLILYVTIANSYAIKYFSNQNHNNTHLSTHIHHHIHNGSSHSHSQINVGFTDFFINTQNINSFTLNLSKQSFLDVDIYTPNLIKDKIFHPPKS